MIDIAAQLSSLAGDMERVAAAGAALTPYQVRCLVELIQEIGIHAGTLQVQLRRAHAQLDDIVADAAGQALAMAVPSPRRRRRPLRVIEGGRA